MKKIKQKYMVDLFKDNEGFWRIKSSGAMHGEKFRIREQAEQKIKTLYENAKKDLGDKYELTLERLDQ